MSKKMTFALAFCNRGFMPGELIYGAREDMIKAVTDAGYDYIAMDADLTRYGGIETRDEGLLYAKWLKEHEGQYDGVIFSMPIFADENGAITALQDAGVPILMQAYPDEIGKMDFAHRRDAFCGKFSVTDVFTQYQVPFTVLKPHVVHPLSEKFQENLRDFAAICRVVNGMKRFTIGCIGARTTAFKTTRFDEIGLQKNGITVEAFDLSEVFYKVNASNGQEIVDAFASVKPGDYDMILMDVQMPVMDGLDATRRIRNGENPLGRTIPILAMTANAFLEDMQKSKEAGMDEHLSKPVDISALEQTVKRFRVTPPRK